MEIPGYDLYLSVFNYWIGAILMQDLGYDFSIMALVPFLHLQASEYEGQPLWRGSIALLLTAPFAKRCLLLQDVDLSPIAFHFFFALPCVGEMTSACKSMKCTSRSRAALASSRSRGAQVLESAPAPPSVLLRASSSCAKPVQMHWPTCRSRVAQALENCTFSWSRAEQVLLYIQPTINSSCSSNYMRYIYVCLAPPLYAVAGCSV